MALEIAGALAIALLVIWVVFEPLLASPRPGLMIPEPDAAEETRRGIALIALKEIEFDRETGKLSDDDYEMLKERYSAEALNALAEEERAAPSEVPAAVSSAAVCPRCGPRPEPDAIFCSSCGMGLGS
jgi:zinc ribbon protein